MPASRARAEDGPTVVPPMRGEMVDSLVVHLLRNPQVMSYALSSVDAAYFSREPHYRLLWPVLAAKNREHRVGQVPYRDLYCALCEAIDNAAEELTEPEVAGLIGTPDLVDHPDLSIRMSRVGVLHHAYFEAGEDELNDTFGMALLRRFLQERAVSEAARSQFVISGQMVRGDIEAVLEGLMGRLASIKAIGQSHVLDLSDPDRTAAPILVRSTGVPWLDARMDGGHAPGETHLVLTPQKGGKTMLAVQLCCAQLELSYRAYLRGEEPLYAYHFTYEEPLTPDLENRYYCCGARILRERLKYELHGPADYSRRGRLLPYEVAMYRDAGEDLARQHELPGEWDRLQAWKGTCARYLKIKDLRLKQNSRNGGGGIHEVVEYLNAEAAAGRRPGIVVLDYVTKAIENQLVVNDWDDREFRRRAINYVCMAESHVAMPFHAPVWMLQQFSQEVQSKSPATLLTTNMGGEVRTLGANVNFAFCFSNRDRQTQVAQCLVDRARRTRTQGDVMQLRFDGDFSRWADVSGQFDVNDATGEVTPKARAAAAAGGVDAGVRRRLATPAADPFGVERAFAAGGGDAEDLY